MNRRVRIRTLVVRFQTLCFDSIYYAASVIWNYVYFLYSIYHTLSFYIFINIYLFLNLASSSTVYKYIYPFHCLAQAFGRHLINICWMIKKKCKCHHYKIMFKIESFLHILYFTLHFVWHLWHQNSARKTQKSKGEKYRKKWHVSLESLQLYTSKYNYMMKKELYHNF